MALLEVSGLSKSFDAADAVNGASLTAERGEILCLLGPSGCGKTTLLRLIAGIEEPDEGTVTFEGLSMEGVAPQKRGFGLMFQDLALFPHMDVFGNVAFGLRMQRQSGDGVRQRVGELLALVDMAEFGGRKVHELSGGERQRVALARSLAPAPRLLMLDEPLGALDRALRDSLQTQIRAILKEVNVTSIYVTHDRDEAFAVADRLVFMNRGRIVQAGLPEQVFAAPRDEFVARSLGFKNILPGVVVSQGEMVEVRCAIGVVSAAGKPNPTVTDGEEVRLLIEEGAIEVVSGPYDGPVGRNILSGAVSERVFMGGQYELKVALCEGALYCSAQAGPAGSGLGPGSEVSLVIDPAAAKILKPS